MFLCRQCFPWYNHWFVFCPSSFVSVKKPNKFNHYSMKPPIWDSFISLHVLLVYSFVFLSCILLYRCNTFCLLVPQLKHVYPVFQFLLIANKTVIYLHLDYWVSSVCFLFHTDKYIGVGWIGHRAKCAFNIIKSWQNVFQNDYIILHSKEKCDFE